MDFIEEPIGSSFTEDEWGMGTSEHKPASLPFQAGSGGEVLQTYPGMGKHVPEPVRRFLRKKVCRITELQCTSGGDWLVIECIPISFPDSR